MSFLDDLAKFIVANTTSGFLQYPSVGFNVFTSYWPDSLVTPDFGLGIFESPSPAPQYVMGQVVPSHEVALIQLQVRATDYDTAIAAAYDIYTHCGGSGTSTTGALTIIAMLAKQRPYVLRRDDKLRPYIGCTYEVMKEPSA